MQGETQYAVPLLGYQQEGGEEESFEWSLRVKGRCLAEHLAQGHLAEGQLRFHHCLIGKFPTQCELKRHILGPLPSGIVRLNTESELGQMYRSQVDKSR